MAFFNKKKFLLAFLNNAELRLASYEVSGSSVSRRDYETLQFKSSVVKDSTILDIQNFQSELASFFSQKKELGKLPVLLIIPEEKVFLKGYELNFGDLEKKEQLKREFISEIPYEEKDLVFHERLIGKVLEFSAVHRRFLEDFQLPFLNQKMPVLGVVTIPQIMALDLHPTEKSFLLAFYDNDFALALAENSSIIFSETRQLKDGNIREAMRAFDHFVQHLEAVDIKSISIILGEEAIEDAIKIELEQREYLIKLIKKISILDMIAGYYDSHKEESVEWNLIRPDAKPMFGFLKFSGFSSDSKKLLLNASLVLLTFAFMGGVGWWTYGMLKPDVAGQLTQPVEVPAVEPPVSETNPESGQAVIKEEPAVVVEAAPAKKSDFPIQIFNGTKLAGEAGRLKAVLVERGFAVSGTGNNEDQNQVVTTIFVNSNAPDSVVGDLRTVLESRYSNVLVSPSPVMGKDIHIVIGAKK